jgi:hypothetical protein
MQTLLHPSNTFLIIMGFQLNVPFIQDTDKARDIAYAMLAGKMLTTVISLLLGITS